MQNGNLIVNSSSIKFSKFPPPSRINPGINSMRGRYKNKFLGRRCSVAAAEEELFVTSLSLNQCRRPRKGAPAAIEGGMEEGVGGGAHTRPKHVSPLAPQRGKVQCRRRRRQESDRQTRPEFTAALSRAQQKVVHVKPSKSPNLASTTILCRRHM